MGVLAEYSPCQFVGNSLPGHRRPCVDQSLHGPGGFVRRRMRVLPVRVAAPGDIPSNVQDVLGREGEAGQWTVGRSLQIGAGVFAKRIQMIVEGTPSSCHGSSSKGEPGLFLPVRTCTR